MKNFDREKVTGPFKRRAASPGLIVFFMGKLGMGGDFTVNKSGVILLNALGYLPNSVELFAEVRSSLSHHHHERKLL